jgi:hypothetical protein
MSFRFVLVAVFFGLSLPAVAADTFQLVRVTAYDNANGLIYDTARGNFTATGTATLDGNLLTIVRTITGPGQAPVQTTRSYTLVNFSNNIATLRDQFNVDSELALVSFPIPTISVGPITDTQLNFVAIPGVFPSVEQWMLSAP